MDSKNKYATDDALVELAHRASSFTMTLAEQKSVSTFSDRDSNSIIEELTECVLFMYYFSF